MKTCTMNLKYTSHVFNYHSERHLYTQYMYTQYMYTQYMYTQYMYTHNTEKSGIMHLRKRTIERSNIRFAIGDREIPMVAEYKYLGCAIDEFLDLNSMVECRARMGRSALSMWIQRCRSCVGDLHIGTYRKLMAAMVDTVVMYGAEVWGCLGKLQIVEHLQMRSRIPDVSGCEQIPSQDSARNGDGRTTFSVGGQNQMHAVLV